MDTDKIINADLAALEAAVERRRENIVDVHLAAMVERVRDVTSEIQLVLENSKSNVAAMRGLCNLLSGVIVEAADGGMAVLEYVQKQMSKQMTHVFVGTHWVMVRTQKYYDFVKDAAYRCGLSSSYAENPDFMNKLFEQVAFCLARDRQTFVPHDAVWINMENGTLEVKDGQAALRPHDREDFFTYVLPYAYDPMAECPLWHRFLDQVLPNAEQQCLLAEYLGYCFTTNLKLEKMAVFYGTGANGKSVCTDIINEVLGRENCSHVDLEKLTTDDNHRVQFEGKLANISSENGVGVLTSTLKVLVSGEPVMVKSLYRDVRMMTLYGKLIASYNILPKTENTEGFFRRWLLFKFAYTIPEKDRDVHLTQKLKKELPGILNWALTGLNRIVANNSFSECQACTDALNDYKLASNSALVFADDRLVVNEDGRLTLKELYPTYLNYCREEGFKNPFGKSNFYKQLEAIGVKKKIIHGAEYLNLMYKSEG